MIITKKPTIKTARKTEKKTSRLKTTEKKKKQ